MIVVNFIGGPGAGKSSLAAGVFSELKWRGINCELALEFAKDKVWEGSLRVLEDQVYILGKQYHRLFRLKGQVDVALTDSPLFLSLLYGQHMGDAFATLALELFHQYSNLVYLVQRVKPYNPAGRVQSEEKARALDSRIEDLLKRHDIPYTVVPGKPESQAQIVEDIKYRIADNYMAAQWIDGHVYDDQGSKG